MNELLKSDSALTDQMRLKGEFVVDFEFNQSSDRLVNQNFNNLPEITQSNHLLSNNKRNTDGILLTGKVNHKREPSTMMSVIRQEPKRDNPKIFGTNLSKSIHGRLPSHPIQAQ